MATPAQIAARKKFAERARSGELAKMRKNNPAKKPTRAASRKANPSSKNLVLGSGQFTVSKWNRAKNTASGNPVYDFELMYEFNGEMYSGKTKPNASFVYQYGNQIREGDSIIATLEKTPSGRVYMTNIKEKRRANPMATRTPSRKRTQLVSNGERKKNPVVKTFPAYGTFRFKVETSTDGVNFRDPVGFPKKLDAIKYAKLLAKLEPRLFIRVYELTAADLSYAV